jgi:hypothetical protein
MVLVVVVAFVDFLQQRLRQLMVKPFSPSPPPTMMAAYQT